ncbi:MAG: serine hydrolase domain-containing protein, partial [Actinomycetes bacterium]
MTRVTLEVEMGSSIDGSAIDRVLQDAVDAGAVPHVAAIAADRDGVVYEGGAGVRVVGESSDRVTTSTQFRIMSMTKMVCTAAALQQIERGDLEMEAPVDAYLPEFADVQVLEGFDGDRPKLRPAGGRATVRQLITHTAGLGYWFWNADLVKYQDVTGL